MKRAIRLIIFLLVTCQMKAQLSGLVQIPSGYPSLASVIVAMNQQGISGALTVNIAPNYTETVPQGGFSLTATGSATSPIIFSKSGAGANPLLLAYAGGSGTPGSMNQDGFWRLIGCDYITIDGIDLLDLNTSNPATMEFGFGLFKANASDGCQNNIIRNCTISLNRINNAGGSGPAADGSRGIDVVNALSNVHNSGVAVSSFSGSNSNNKFYSNMIGNCNIGISLSGFVDTAPFSFADTGNEIGGNSPGTGNQVFDFGGGGSANAAIGIKTLAQYNITIGFNTVNNNTGAGVDHPVILRGIYLNTATSANVSVINNTITLHGGGTSSQLSAIENLAGSTATSNSVIIEDNVIVNCTYNSATSGPFYGIWNTASPDILSINRNVFLNNSTTASSGSTYLIYNNGAVATLVNINDNNLGFAYNGSTAYTGNLYNIYNANGTLNTQINIRNNNFSNYNYSGNPGTGNLYFINNTNDSYALSIDKNTWTNLYLNHSGAHYLINNNSATQTFLTVNNNSILGTYNRLAAAGSTYLYYATGSSPASCIQTFTGNIFSNITATLSGTGNFYGLYNSDGASSPYPKKLVAENLISNININSTGTFYGYFMDNLGDSNGSVGSAVYNNTLTNISRAGVIYGLYVSGTVSPQYPPRVYGNWIHNLNTSGASSNLYAVYLGGGGGGLNFYKNKISTVTETGSSGLAHGIYIASAANTTLANNFIGSVSAPNSSAANAVNGVFINAGTLVNVFYNTIYLNAVSLGGNFNSNALFASTTTSLNLRNSVLINLSSGGTGVAAAYRRSTTSLTNYLSSSNNNLFYAGTPSPNNVLLQSGATAYQTLTAFQMAVSPREANSISQNVSFLNISGASPNYLHIVPNSINALESAALNIAGITDDFDSQVRQGNTGYAGNGSAPDIGADEFNQNLIPCSGANAGLVSPLSTTLCAGQSASLISTGYTPGTGISHQWKVAATPGGTYSNPVSGSGSTSPEFISAPLVPGNYYFVLQTTCAAASVSATSAEATVVVNAIPQTSAAANAALICSGQTLSLSAQSSLPANYQWYGPNGFISVLQSPTRVNVGVLSTGIYYVSARANGCSSSQSSVSVSVSEVTLSVSALPSVVCLGGITTLSLSASASSFTWSNGATAPSFTLSPSSSSTFSVVVTNTANCSVAGSVALSVINPTISAIASIACGTAATVSLSVNAFTPSLVSWFTNPTTTLSLASGTFYTASISTSTTFFAEASNTLSGCQSQRIPVTVTLAPFPTLSITATPSVVCPGKSSTVTVYGASSYSFAGIGSGSVHVVSPTANKVYTITGKTSFSCATTQTVLVTTHSLAVLLTAQTATSVCPSGVVGLSVTGASSYFWSSGASGSATTVTPAINSTYTVYGTNTQNCTSSSTLSIATRSVPFISITQSTDAVCPGTLVTFTAFGASSYTWLPGNVSSLTFSANPFVSSVYNAIGSSVNSCTNVAIASVLVDPCTGLGNEILSSWLTLFPNPAKEFAKVQLAAEGSVHISIFSAFGVKCFDLYDFTDEINLDLSDFQRGIYFVELTAHNKRFIQKLILD